MKEKKIWEFLSENFQFLEVKFSVYLNRRIFVIAKFLLVITHGKHLQLKEQDKEKLKFYCWVT